MAKSDTETETPKDATGKDAPASKLPPPAKLPKGLQEIVNKAERDETLYEELLEGSAPDSTESNVRYAAYATRIRTALLSAQRYVAYTSDIGESFRPVAHPNWVRAAYGISWAYLIGDVSNEGYKAYRQNQRIRHPDLPQTAMQERYNNATHLLPGDSEGEVKLGLVSPLEDYRTVMAQRAVFQGIASMGLPAFTIHSIVRYSGRAMKDVKNVRIRTWGPIGLGLAAVPFLPYLFDEPVETAVEWVFHKGFQTLGGAEAVGHAPSTGRERQLEAKPLHEKKKEKEL